MIIVIRILVILVIRMIRIIIVIMKIIVTIIIIIITKIILSLNSCMGPRCQYALEHAGLQRRAICASWLPPCGNHGLGFMGLIRG